jgi:phosphohistidine phosphatase SixA
MSVRIKVFSALAWMLLAIGGAPTQARADATSAWNALKQGAIVVFRHSNAPGVGDPKGMRIGDCETQRNLDEAGRAQARRIGAAFRTRDIAVGRVLTSQWCRTRETANLAFPGQAVDEPAFNSFFDTPATRDAQTTTARQILLSWHGPGALVVSTHQVNIQALTGIAPASGEGLVLVARDGQFVVAGRIQP